MIGSNRFQNGSLIRVKNKNAADTWFLRYYEDVLGKRVYRKRKIGTVRDYPHRRDAEKAVLSLRSEINSNSGVRSPETVNSLIAHYSVHELGAESGKRSSTREVYAGFLKLHVAPQWGSYRISEIKTVAVEKWLHGLEYAPATKNKIRNIMSAVFNHAIRHEWMQHNPITHVRCSSKRLREPDVLTPEEFNSLLDELPLRERVMVMLAGTTGLRRSELIALTWRDLDFNLLQVDVNKSCVRAQIGDTKTVASAKPVPLHPVVASALRKWRSATPYSGEDDFLFPSIRENGTKPVWPDMILQKIIRPALERAGIRGKRVGWHTFRHSLGTNLRSLGVDVKVAQELLRHANSKITLDLYTQAVSSQKREANARVVEMLLPSLVAAKERRHPSAPSKVSSIAVSR
jgi:integrase